MPEAQADPSLSNPSAAGQSPVWQKRRRKIRKGTQSCWECKRRKTRCTFSAPTDTICDGCRSRCTKCISQEFHDSGALVRTNGDRLSRMEFLVDRLANRSSATLPDTLRPDRPDQYETADLMETPGRDNGITNLELFPPPDPIVASESNIASLLTRNLDEISQALLAVWPDQHNLDLIMSIPVDISVLLHGTVCIPYSKLITNHLTSTHRMLALPASGSHPILIARRLLLLATLLQGIPACSFANVVGMALDGRVLMSRVFSTASRLVTSNDEFVNSLEGIECIMIESMYLNNAGELRRAWMTNRRAMTIAQMLGLNTSSNSASTILEADTRARIDPDYMWFRLVCNDRYLSLMLGLPQGSIDSAFAAPEALQGCTALERMERLMTAAGGLILQRGSTFERADVTTTYKIDKMIQEAAALMSPQWWAANPGSGAVANNDIKAYEETIRLTNQLAYYHLLVQLHLPYMMQNSSMNSNYDYSTLTAASASRAIVTQFVSFRQSITGTAYCRGMDFVAFIASTALCLAHVESRRPRQFDSEKTVRTGLRCLYHQRLRDRGLLERILEIMETAVQVSNDAVAEKISGILRPLLVVEDNSAKGTTYDASASPEVGKQAHHRSGNTDEAFKVLKIEIPYFGTVKIDHRHITHENVGTSPTFTHEQLGHTHASERSDPGFTLLREPNPPRTSHRYGQYYTINATNSGNTDCQDDAFTLNQPPTDRLQQSELTLSADNDCLLLDTDSALLQDDCLFLPTATTGTDDWALQGVDMALFTTLTQNSGD